MHRGAFSAVVIVVTITASLFADYPADKKKYDECVARVRKDYPVPPGNANALSQMIKNECGDPPKPPAR